MIDLILVISIISSPLILMGAIVLYADLSATKRHKKWINDFKKKGSTMILTGKAKTDFCEHCKQDEAWMDTYDDLFLFALIIDWLDSVGIITAVEPSYYDGYTFESYAYDRLGNKHYAKGLFDTRKQATEKAIEKAVELYNETVLPLSNNTFYNLYI